jgi:hypothetical protein
MKRTLLSRALLSIGAAALLAGATMLSPLATSADARMGGHGGGGGGGAHFSGGGGWGGGGVRGGGGAAFRGGGGASFHGGGTAFRGNFGGRVRTGVAPHFRGGTMTRFRGDNRRHFVRHHRHFRGATFAFAFGAPYFYDYGYYDDGCYRLRRVWTDYGWQYVRVNVCGDYDY